MKNPFKVGDLVKIRNPEEEGLEDQRSWLGIVTGFHDAYHPKGCTPCPIVYWNEKYPDEKEYADLLKLAK